MNGPTTHIRGINSAAMSDRPLAHLSPTLSITETAVPGRMVFSSGSDRSSQYSWVPAGVSGCSQNGFGQVKTPSSTMFS